jgi:3-keto-5-aminohexanoate cleavage enzyme
MAQKVIITAAVNGNRLDTPGLHIPVSPDEIAEDAKRCCDAGAAVVHFHARDVKTRRSTADLRMFAETIAGIRTRCGALVETTTGIGPRIDPTTGKPMTDPVTGQMLRPSDDDRLALIDLDPPQDLGSVAAGSLNMYNPVYRDPSVFANTPYYITESVKRMSGKPRFGFQFEVFDLGFLDNVARLADSGLLDLSKRQFWLNYVFGFGGLGPSARNLCLVSGEGVARFAGIPWGAVVPAKEHFPLSTVAAALGADVVRTGFEDATDLPNGELAGTNARLVETLVGLVRSVGRDIASPDEARARFNLDAQHAA